MHDATIYATEATLAMTPHDGAASTVISREEAFAIGDITARSFPVKHLAADPVAFSITFGGVKVSIASDLGSVTERVRTEMSGSDLLMIEANYDEEMLRNGTYPGFLKRAILSDHGHLSNVEAGDLCASAAGGNLKEIVLLHLSRDNNRSHIARESVHSRLEDTVPRVEVTPVEHGSHSGPFRVD